MMRGTGAAFQAEVSLNQQATDSISHTPSKAILTFREATRYPYPQDPMVDPIFSYLSFFSTRRNHLNQDYTGV